MNEQQQVMLPSVVVTPGQLQGASVIVQNAAASVQGKTATINCYMDPFSPYLQSLWRLATRLL